MVLLLNPLSLLSPFLISLRDWLPPRPRLLPFWLRTCSRNRFRWLLNLASSFDLTRGLEPNLFLDLISLVRAVGDTISLRSPSTSLPNTDGVELNGGWLGLNGARVGLKVS